MIAADVATKIRRQVAEQISIEYLEADRLEVSTPFMFTDGDHYGFAILRDGGTGRWRMSDEGEVVSKARYQGVDLLGKGRIERLRRMVEFYGLQESDGELSLAVEDGDFGRAFYLFSQACLDVSRSAKMKADRSTKAAKHEPSPYEELAAIIKRVIPESAQYEPEWHHPQLDPHRIYAVDFYVKAREVPILVFIASNDLECLNSTVSCQHYRQNQLPFESVGLADESRGMSGRGIIALRDAVTHSFSPDQEEELAKYLKAG